MSAARIVGALGSILLHAALLVSLAINLPPLVEPPIPVSTEEPGGIEDVEMHLVATPEADGIGLACESTYRGIGIMHWPNGAVIEVVHGGPADKAGMKVGDYLLSDAMLFRDQYEVGQRLPIRVERDGKQLSLIVYVGVICYETARTIPHLKERP